MDESHVQAQSFRQGSEGFLEPGDALGGSPLWGITGCGWGRWARKQRWVRSLGGGAAARRV